MGAPSKTYIPSNLTLFAYMRPLSVSYRQFNVAIGSNGGSSHRRDSRYLGVVFILRASDQQYGCAQNRY